jgi:hypothetical protein
MEIRKGSPLEWKDQLDDFARQNCEFHSLASGEYHFAAAAADQCHLQISQLKHAFLRIGAGRRLDDHLNFNVIHFHVTHSPLEH